jgi:proline iminopeptidase
LRLFFIILCLLAGCTTPSHESSSDYVQVKQGKLYYQSFGSGEPIIVIHGGPGMMDSSYLLPQMLELTKTNQVIFYDQRGSGKSLETKINPELMNLQQFTQDLDDLRKSLNLDKVTLLGHSWGGIIAMNYAAQYPDYVSRLILLSPAPADHGGIVSFEKACEEKNKNIAEEISPIFSSSTIEKLDVDEIKRLYRKVFVNYVYNSKDAAKISLDFDKKSAISSIKSMEMLIDTTWMNPKFNLLPILKQISAPTLIIHGKDDLIASTSIEQIGKTIPNTKIIYLAKCGHFPFIEQSEETFAAIKGFINHEK